MISRTMRRAVWCATLLLVGSLPVSPQASSWRAATDSELQSVLPSRAQVQSEHIETEMRTASGIVNGRGQFIAGVVLLTAGYSADGKYSHYLVLQAPVRIGGIHFPPGDYVFGWTRAGAEDKLSVHFHQAETGKLIGTTDARRISGSSRVESLRIWPPEEKPIIQIGRFGIPYELSKEK